MSLPVTLRHLMCVWDVTGCSGAGIQQAEGEMKRQQEVSGRADESIELESPSESHTLTGKHRNRNALRPRMIHVRSDGRFRDRDWGHRYLELPEDSYSGELPSGEPPQWRTPQWRTPPVENSEEHPYWCLLGAVFLWQPASSIPQWIPLLLSLIVHRFCTQACKLWYTGYVQCNT